MLAAFCFLLGLWTVWAGLDQKHPLVQARSRYGHRGSRELMEGVSEGSLILHPPGRLSMPTKPLN